MKKNYSSFIFFILVIASAQLACNFASSAATPDTFATLNGLYTAAALTSQVGSAQPATTLTPALPTLTGIPFFEAQTATVGAVTSVSRCDAAEFVSDVTYADGSSVAPNTSFTKIWRLKNIGTCSWTTSYALTFTGGDLMNAPLTVALPKNVNPGETIDLQITLISPKKNGAYHGDWKLRNAAGVLFGIGDEANTAFWVEVKVAGASHVAYAFAPNYCNADWENSGAALPCPGTSGDAQGFVLKLNAPVMENGSTENEPALLVSPQRVNNGTISGQFPAFTVQEGDRFRAMIGCQFDSEKCNVVFHLDYKINGKIKTLGVWYEIYEGLSYPIDVDLSKLAGQTVKFILTVGANGFNSEDDALWLNPHVTRRGTPPPTLAPTFTVTPTFTASPTLTPTFTQTPSETPTP